MDDELLAQVEVVPSLECQQCLDRQCGHGRPSGLRGAPRPEKFDETGDPKHLEYEKAFARERQKKGDGTPEQPVEEWTRPADVEPPERCRPGPPRFIHEMPGIDAQNRAGQIELAEPGPARYVLYLENSTPADAMPV